MWYWLTLKFRRWNYLGYTELSYTNEDETTQSACVVHFYAKGDDLEKRKPKYKSWSRKKMERHGYWGKAIVPWLEGENLFTPISAPSSFLKEWAKDHFNYIRFGNRWVRPSDPQTKPPEVIEGSNIIKLFPDK